MGGKGKKFARGHVSSPSSKHTALIANNNVRSFHSSKSEKQFRHSQFMIGMKKPPPNSPLPLHLKQPFKLTTSPVKRSRPDLRAKEGAVQKIKLSGPTGLETIEIFIEPTDMTEPVSLNETYSSDYLCRDKIAEADRRRSEVSRYVRKLKQQRLISNTIRLRRELLPTRQRGMQNLTGALCYRHSLFQALVHSPIFANWLLKNHQPADCVVEEGEVCVACAMKQVVTAYTSQRADDLTETLRVVNHVFKINKWSAGSWNGHGDPEEQFTWIASTMSRQLPDDVYRTFKSSHCLLTDSVIRCANCTHESRVQANVTSAIPVPLKPRAKDGQLSTYLDRYMREPVEGYRCEKCNNKDDKFRNHLITHSPDLLIIQLLRFDGISGRKDSTPVSFSTSLSLNRYRSPLNKDSSTYNLNAVVIHSGSLGGGHYRCLAKGGDGGWFDFDDSRVSKISVNEVLDPRDGWTPYLLFFQRVRD